MLDICIKMLLVIDFKWKLTFDCTSDNYILKKLFLHNYMKYSMFSILGVQVLIFLS